MNKEFIDGIIIDVSILLVLTFFMGTLIGIIIGYKIIGNIDKVQKEYVYNGE